MDLPIRMRTFTNVKSCHVICLKSRYIFFTSLTKLGLEAIASFCITIQENLLLCYRTFSAVAIAVII